MINELALLLQLSAPSANLPEKHGFRSENHVRICAENFAEVPEKLGLLANGQGPEARDVVFFDTSSLSLHQSGLALRARVGDSWGEFTVKLRVDNPEPETSDLYKNKGFKCELDRSLPAAFWNCSFTIAIEPDAIKKIETGKNGASSLVSKKQSEWLASHDRALPADEDLRFLGRMRSTVWKGGGSDGVFEMESWQIPRKSQGDSMILAEVSARTSLEESQVQLRELADWAVAHQVSLCSDQQSKTAEALEILTH